MDEIIRKEIEKIIESTLHLDRDGGPDPYHPVTVIGGVDDLVKILVERIVENRWGE